MPVLFYGTTPEDRRTRLYDERMVPFETSIFDKYKLQDLAPFNRGQYTANHWWVYVNPRLPHTALAWHDENGKERTVFLPGELRWQDTLTLARELFKPLIPSAIVFRLNNYKRPFRYD